MTKTKYRPTIGDRLWHVEWCSKLAFYDDDETGEVDRDNCTMSTKSFRTRDEARAFAEKTWPATQETFGIVTVDEIEFVPYDEDDATLYPHAGHWENVREESEIFSGEWES